MVDAGGRADTARQAIVKSVHVQAEHDEADPERETAWLQAVADLSEPGVEKVLEGHAAHHNTRGIRQMLNFDPRAAAAPAHNPLAKRKNLLADPVFQSQFALLRRYDLSFDLQIFPRQAADAATLARLPNTAIKI